MEGVFQGFIDHHTHAVSYGIKKSRIDLSKTHSKIDALRIVEEYLQRNEDILIAEDWDESKWDEGQFPKKEELDSISKDKPIILRRICGHIAVCNTPAIEKIPEGYMVDRERGILFEDAVLYLNEIFPPSYQQIKEAILLMQEDFLSLGIVGINDIVTPDYHRAYAEIDREGKLHIKVRTFLVDTHLEETRDLKNTKMVSLEGIKIFTDGSIGARTAAVENFRYIETDKKGLLLKDARYITEMIEFSEKKKLTLAIHAIGDRAIGEVIKGFNEYGPFSMPHRIEHFELATDREIEEAVRIGLTLSMQPNFIGNWSLPGGLYQRAFGDIYFQNNRIGLIHRKGGKIIFGSDGMPYSPLYGINSVSNSPFEEQRIETETAFRLYTDEDAQDTNVVIKNGEVVETIIGGKSVYRRDYA